MIYFFRVYAWLFRLHIPILPRVMYIINRIVFSIALPPSVQVGKRVTFAYQGLGVVVHARAVVGDDVYIGPQVIIGGRSGELLVPRIQSGVFIGAGARILGPIEIGAGATIAAGAVVLSNVGPGEVVAGIPAHPISSSRRESSRQ